MDVSSPSLPAVVPAPVELRADPSAPPFLLTPSVRITGPAGPATAFAAAAGARIGESIALGDSGAITFTLAAGGAPESYRIAADATAVTVTAPDEAGLFYGAHTLAQLVTRRDASWIVPAVEVDDAPRFSYRGVMLDVARHFFDVDTVRGYIDRAASLKFNVLHLHLSDDQGWRLALDSRPALAERASATAVGGDPGGYFTKADYAAIIAHAASRHMMIVPEIDMPGHTHAVGLAHPELVEAPVIADAAAVEEEPPVAGEPYQGISVGFSSLKINDERTYDFVADVFGELTAMTPGPYLHFGGDESLATSAEDFAVFIARVSALIAHLGKTPVAWHEAGAAAGLDDTTIGQYWGNTAPTDDTAAAARAFVALGSQLILSPADAIYLDMKFDADSPLGLTWANGPTSVREAYSWEPATLIDGVGEDDILGIEAPLWTETARTAQDLDALAFPRIAAAAEIAWSPASARSPLRTWASFRTRVGALGPLWTALGIDYTPSPEIDWSTS